MTPKPISRHVRNKEGLLHCLEGPAVELEDGYRAWYKEGKLHRIGGPALTQPGMIAYYKEGILHRCDGPALIKPDVQVWYFNGKVHSTQVEAINVSCVKPHILLGFPLLPKSSILLVIA